MGALDIFGVFGVFGAGTRVFGAERVISGEFFELLAVVAFDADEEEGELDEVFGEADVGAEEEVVEHEEGHGEDLGEAEGGEVVAGDVDGVEDGVDDDEGGNPAVVKNDADGEVEEAEKSNSPPFEGAVFAEDDEVADGADDVDEEVGHAAEEDVLGAGEDVGEGAIDDDFAADVGESAQDIGDETEGAGDLGDDKHKGIITDMGGKRKARA